MSNDNKAEPPDGSTDVHLRALVVSDIHAVPDSRPEQASWADMSERKNPIDALPDFLAGKNARADGEKVKADVVLCPGDLAHQAHGAATTWAWAQLQKIAKSVGADRVIATAGNHDVDSRHIEPNLDPCENLKELQPPFPLESSNDYWANSMSLVIHDGWRIVTLNSCFHHGANEQEHRQGRIESSAITKLNKQLSATDADAEVNILLCHHHPMPHTELDPNDRSSMVGGDRLLDLLDRGRHGRWLIVHGHKHFPWLSYAPGSSISPVVFSAASASVLLYPALSTRVRNQVHLIEFDTARSRAVDLHLAGTFESWMWSTGDGWAPAPVGSGLPGQGGFGFRVDLTDLARRIADEHTRLGKRVLRTADLHAMEPRLEYIAPIDLVALEEILQSNHGIRLSRMSNGPIADTTTA